MTCALDELTDVDTSLVEILELPSAHNLVVYDHAVGDILDDDANLSAADDQLDELDHGSHGASLAVDDEDLDISAPLGIGLNPSCCLDGGGLTWSTGNLGVVVADAGVV